MIDPLRHISVFDPDRFGDKRVDIIGVGATGSKVAISLAKLGVQNIHIWDFDKIEEHNIANQMFDIGDIGKKKVIALYEIIKRQTGEKITIHDEKVDGSQALGEVVFLLTDTMASRKEIWERGLKMKLRTKVVIETRMGIDEGRLYTVNPCQLSEIKQWEGTLYTDKEAAVSACGSSPTVGPTAGIIAEMAVWQMLRWFSIERQDEAGKKDKIESEILIALRPTMTVVRNF